MDLDDVRVVRQESHEFGLGVDARAVERVGEGAFIHGFACEEITGGWRVDASDGSEASTTDLFADLVLVVVVVVVLAASHSMF